MKIWNSVKKTESGHLKDHLLCSAFGSEKFFFAQFLKAYLEDAISAERRVPPSLSFFCVKRAD